MFEHLLEYDRQLLVYLNNLGIERYDFFWSAITKTVFWIPLFLLFIYLVHQTWKSNKPWGSHLTVIAVLGFTLLLTSMVKALVSRIRPSGEVEFSKLLRVLLEPESFSFFSGHAANSFALTTIVVLLTQHRYRWVTGLYAWPVLFSFSRIYVGVHYPSDIIVGMLTGMAMAIAGYKIHHARRNGASLTV